jgi:hypothetical protein
MATHRVARVTKPMDRLQLSAAAAPLTLSPVPTSVRSALTDPDWCRAMEEYEALLSNSTWELVPRPSGDNIVTDKWIFKHKLKADGSLDRYKLKNAFLDGTLSEMIYYSQPTGFVVLAHPQLVCQLNKSLYSLKQAPRAWYHCFASYLVSQGFAEAKSDTSLFIYRHGTDTAYLLLYIDDIILTASSPELL